MIDYSGGMPRKNLVRNYGEGQYYHVYNRGANKSDIFRDEDDYLYLLHLLKIYLSNEESKDEQGRPRKNFSQQVELVAYCLIPNHLHMLFYLREREGITALMRSVMTVYSMYFNKKYRHSGTVFESTFLASSVSSNEYLWHVSRYIHLNPIDIGQNYRQYPYSSIGYFLGSKYAKWLHPEHLVATEAERASYSLSLRDGVDHHRLYKILRKELAN